MAGAGSSPEHMEQIAKIHHTHGPNFGRYVVGCPVCMEKYPDGPVRRVSHPRKKYTKAPPPDSLAAVAERTGLSIDQLKQMMVSSELPPSVEATLEPEPLPIAEPPTALEDRAAPGAVTGSQIAAQAGLTLEQLAYFAKLMKEPDEATQAKLARDKARMETNRKHDIEVAILEEQMKIQRESNCNHRKENGRSAIMGQIHSDGLYHPICIHCFKAFPPVRPTADQMQMGTA